MKSITLSIRLAALCSFFFIFITACKKIDAPEKTNTETNIRSMPPPTPCDQQPTICEDCAVQEANENDTASLATILGGTINNPYSITIMKQAINNIFGVNLPALQPTHYYIKITCNDINLVDELESQDVELYDHPLNRHVLQDGDSWPEAYAGLPDGDIPPLYAVIEKGFVMSAGINYQVLEPLYIPDNNDALEDEAFYLTGNLDCALQYSSQTKPAVVQYYQTNKVDPCELDPSYCGGGGTGGGGGGVTGGHRKPSGQINYNSYVANPLSRIEADQPLKNVRLVGRRFFKIDKTFTDNNGNFVFSKSFPRKVTVIVKFRTSSYFGKHSVRENPKNFGFWKGRFAVKKNIGTYKGNQLSGLNYKFEKGDKWYRNKTRKWVAAVSLNTMMDYDNFLNSNGLYKLPNDVRIYINQSWSQSLAREVPEFDFIRRSTAPCTNQNSNFWNAVGNTSANTLFLGAAIGTIISSAVYGTSAAVYSPAFTGAFLKNMKGRADIYLHYATLDVNNMSSTKVALSVGHQLGIVYLNKLTNINGNTDDFSKYKAHLTHDNISQTYDNYKPYGAKTGNGGGADRNFPQLVAIWQMFAQHMAQSVVDYSYGTGAEPFKLQNIEWQSTATQSSSKRFLEGFNPTPINPTDDYFNWIPVGLINDLMDTNNESFPVNDNVSGFTYNNLFSVLSTHPTTMLQFKNSAIGILPGQATQINNLFTSYGY
jgi:hypothetical protein